MERYQRVSKPRPEAAIKENEVRITTQGLMRSYISYASSLLQDRRFSEIVLKAMGRAINKTVMVAEILKRRIEGLHQNVAISSTDITDVWEPLEEGLVPLEMTRHVSMITITLSKKELDVSSSGYQAPAVVKRIQPLRESNYDEGGARGRGRGIGPGRGQVQGRGRGNMPVGGGYFNSGDENWNRGRGRNGGGRARGYRGGGRGFNTGGYNGYQQTETNRYNDGGYGDRDMGFRGRGRGWRGGRGRGRGA